MIYFLKSKREMLRINDISINNNGISLGRRDQAPLARVRKLSV